MKRKNVKIYNGTVSAMATTPEGLVAYNMLETDDDSVEINMYGNVVSKQPVDIWTGEPLPGLYIALDSFLKDLDRIKDKKNIKVHINSVGGELTAGLAIMNRLSQLKGKVTTVCDALAASAAGLILQAGDERLMFPGSQIMLHCASCLLYGYYDTAELLKISNNLESANKTVVDAYSKRTGNTPESIMDLLKKETWMTGHEAIDAGYADGFVTEGDEAKVTMSADKKIIYGNGIPMSAIGFKNMPSNISIEKMGVAPVQPVNSVVTGSQPDAIKNNKDGGTKMTLEELMKSDPALVEQIRNEAVASVRSESNEAAQNAVNSERKRLQEIESIENAIADKELVAKAKYGETAMSAQELAFKAMQQDAAAGKEFLANMQEGQKASGINDVTSVPVSNVAMSADEQRAKDIADGAALIAGVKEV